ncbi:MULTISPECIES: hypothetical protein [Streptomyces]|nr:MULTISPECIES: hypothetical protein [Streptomyces]
MGGTAHANPSAQPEEPWLPELTGSRELPSEPMAIGTIQKPDGNETDIAGIRFRQGHD